MHLLLFLARSFLVCKDYLTDTSKTRSTIFFKVIAALGIIVIAIITVAFIWFISSIIISAFSAGILFGFIVLILLAIILSY